MEASLEEASRLGSFVRRIHSEAGGDVREGIRCAEGYDAERPELSGDVLGHGYEEEPRCQLRRLDRLLGGQLRGPGEGEEGIGAGQGQGKGQGQGRGKGRGPVEKAPTTFANATK